MKISLPFCLCMTLIIAPGHGYSDECTENMCYTPSFDGLPGWWENCKCKDLDAAESQTIKTSDSCFQVATADQLRFFDTESCSITDGILQYLYNDETGEPVYEDDDTLKCAYTYTCPAGQYVSYTTDTYLKCEKCPTGFVSPTGDYAIITDVSGTYDYEYYAGNSCNYEINSERKPTIPGSIPDNVMSVPSGKPCPVYCPNQNADANEDQTNCVCKKGYTTQNNQTTVIQDGMVHKCSKPISYEIEFSAIGGLKCSDEPQQWYYVYDMGYTKDADCQWYNCLADSNTQFCPSLKKDKHDLKGYSLQAWNGKIFLDGNIAGPNHDKNILEETNNVEAESFDLYAVFEPKNYNVAYLDSTGGDAADPQTCTYSTQCIAKKTTTVNNAVGNYFSHWVRETDKAKIKPGEAIPELTSEYADDTVELYAVFEPCESGYYCEENKAPAPCPAGSTSNTGAKSIEDCFLAGGATQLCKGDKCIKLPQGWKINHL